MSVELLVGIVGVAIALATLIWKIIDSRRPIATLLPRRPNFGPDHVDIWFWLVNESNRAIELLGAEAQFDYPGAEGKTFTATKHAFRMGGIIEPGKKMDNGVKIPFLNIGEEWRRLREQIPNGRMRLKVKFGIKPGHTKWASIDNAR